jgi:hypothetical protein
LPGKTDGFITIGALARELHALREKTSVVNRSSDGWVKIRKLLRDNDGLLSTDLPALVFALEYIFDRAASGPALTGPELQSLASRALAGKFVEP